VAMGGWIMIGHSGNGGSWPIEEMEHPGDRTTGCNNVWSSRHTTNLLYACHGTDHSHPQCALSYIYRLPLRHPPQQRQASNRPSQGVEICKSWNKGACIFPGRCWFRHVCTKCQLPHKAKDCPTTLDQRPQVQLTRPQPGALASPRPWALILE